MPKNPRKVEVWKAIPGFEGMYEVSSFGRVRSLTRVVVMRNGAARPHTGRVLSLVGKEKNLPYLQVVLSKTNGYGSGATSKSYRVHQLVLLVFEGPAPAGLQVRHLDGSSYNNRLDNLRYGTPKENQHDRRLHGTNHGAKGSAAGKSKLTERQVLTIRRLYAKGGVAQKELAKQYGVNPSVISCIVHGKNWTHVGGQLSNVNNRCTGSRNKLSKLTERQAKKIRAEYARGNVTQRELGDKYGVKQACISALLCGYTWQHAK